MLSKAEQLSNYIKPSAGVSSFTSVSLGISGTLAQSKLPSKSKFNNVISAEMNDWTMGGKFNEIAT